GEGVGGEDDYEQPDEIESRVKLGEIWQLGRHKIACGDSTIESNVRALLGDKFGDVGMVWADPPFNTKQQQGRTSSEWGIIKNDNLSDSDFKKFVENFADIVSRLKPESIYVCCNWRSYPLFFSLFPDINNLIVWIKNNFGLGSGYRPQYELIIFQGKIESHSESNVWNIDKDSVNSYNHPMQKPIKLIEKAFANSTQSNDLIFDPFLGSAPSIIAAEKMEGDRTVYGFELSPDYCEVIIQRWEKFTGKQAELIGRLDD
ncbi:MAG: DNA-methyltransferase, partial [Dolichospermum sp.]